MIARPSTDLVPFRILNLTGQLVVLIDKGGAIRTSLPSAGVVQFVNESRKTTTEFLGIPVYRYSMRPTAGLPPVPATWNRETNPLYNLVDPFTANTLMACRVRRPDILTMVDYTRDAMGCYHVKALGAVPLLG